MEKLPPPDACKLRPPPNLARMRPMSEVDFERKKRKVQNKIRARALQYWEKAKEKQPRDKRMILYNRKSRSPNCSYFSNMSLSPFKPAVAPFDKVTEVSSLEKGYVIFKITKYNEKENCPHRPIPGEVWQSDDPVALKKMGNKHTEKQWAVTTHRYSGATRNAMTRLMQNKFRQYGPALRQLIESDDAYLGEATSCKFWGIGLDLAVPDVINPTVIASDVQRHPGYNAQGVFLMITRDEARRWVAAFRPVPRPLAAPGVGPSKAGPSKGVDPQPQVVKRKIKAEPAVPQKCSRPSAPKIQDDDDLQVVFEGVISAPPRPQPRNPSELAEYYRETRRLAQNAPLNRTGPRPDANRPVNSVPIAPTLAPSRPTLPQFRPVVPLRGASRPTSRDPGPSALQFQGPAYRPTPRGYCVPLVPQPQFQGLAQNFQGQFPGPQGRYPNSQGYWPVLQFDPYYGPRW